MKVSLDDKYSLDTGQSIYDRHRKHWSDCRFCSINVTWNADSTRPASFRVTRGSPIGGLDQALWKAKRFTEAHNIHFLPGVNEDLAMTSVWGSQQVGLFPGAKYDGVFGLWYGKGPGLDRSMDVLKACKCLWHLPLRRCTRGSWRRPRLQVFHLTPSKRSHVYRRYQPGTQSRWRTGSTRSRYFRLGTVALQRLLGRTEGNYRKHGRGDSAEIDPDRVRVVLPDDYELPEDGCPYALARFADGAGRATATSQDLRGRAFARANNLNSIELDSGQTPGLVLLPPANPTSTRCRHSVTSASMTSSQPKSAFAYTRSA